MLRIVSNHVAQGWGKVRRMYFVYINKKYVRRQLLTRQGECQRCGACCELMFKCPALKRNNGTALCAIYDSRSNVCKLFPLDERDIRDRNRIRPNIKCGWQFSNGHPTHAPLRKNRS